MNLNKKGRINFNIDFGLAAIFFIVLFLPKIGVFDLKALALFLIFIFQIRNINKVTIKETNILIIIVSLFLLTFLFIFNAILNVDSNYFILFRYLRALLSVIALSLYFRNKDISIKKFLNTFFCIMGLHIVAILISMAIPEVRPYLYAFNSYSAKELPLRSTGLVSGYDVAGFYLNITFLLNIFYNLKFYNKPFSLYTILLVFASIFTSRLNTVIMVLQLCFVLMYLVKKHKISSVFSSIFIIIVLFVGSLFTILTIDFFSEIRYELINKYDWIRSLSMVINRSYSNSNVESAINSHYAIGSQINWLIGNGIRAPYDPGFVNTVYEGGIVAISIKYLCYLSIVIRNLLKDRSFLALFVCYIALMTLLFEIKLVFCFASGVFEIFLIFIFARINESRYL